MRHVLKLSADLLLSPYIGDQLGQHGLWTCENGDYLARQGPVHDPAAQHRRCQAAIDGTDWLADTKVRVKREIVAGVVKALELTPLEAVRRRALAIGAATVPGADGYETVDSVAGLARIAEVERGIHARAADACARVNACATMADLRAARDEAVAPAFWGA